MAIFAAKCLVVLALATQGADAAVTCATGWTAKTGVDNVYCNGDATSCQTDTDCCTMGAMCAAANPTCDAGMYNMADTTLVGSNAKAACCVNQATCSQATCPAGYEKDSDTSNTKCPGGASTCGAYLLGQGGACCKLIAGTCMAWRSAPNTCPNGKNVFDYGKTGSDADACCSAVVKCNTHTCPATHQLKANAANVPTAGCAAAACTNAECCDVKTTVCLGAGTISCGTNKYRDPNKAGVTVTVNKATDCCSNQAQCKDTANIDAASASVAVTPSLFLIAAVLYATAK